MKEKFKIFWKYSWYQINQRKEKYLLLRDKKAKKDLKSGKITQLNQQLISQT